MVDHLALMARAARMSDDDLQAAWNKVRPEQTLSPQEQAIADEMQQRGLSVPPPIEANGPAPRRRVLAPRYR